MIERRAAGRRNGGRRKDDLAPAVDRAAPHSLDAERALLGAAILHPQGATEVLRLPASDFFRVAHREIWAAIQRLADNGSAIDFVTIRAELERVGQLEDVGGPAYLAGLVDGVPLIRNAQHYAAIVQEHAGRRALIAAAGEIQARGYEAEVPVREMIDLALRRVGEVERALPRGGFVRVRDLVVPLMSALDEAHSGRHGYVTGLATGFSKLDEMLTGLQPGDLVLLAARPSIGKTALAMNAVEHAGVDLGLPVGVFSLEMSKEQLMTRLAASRARVNLHSMRAGYTSDAEVARIGLALGELDAAPIFIDDTPGLSIEELAIRARLLKADEGARLIVVDYIQLVTSREAFDSRQQELSTISRSLKTLARELRVPVVALSQLSRAVEVRKDRRPQLSDLRESGALEQDADVVLMIWRPDHDADERAEVLVRKQRNGPLGAVSMTFLREFTRFELAASAAEGEE